MRRLTGVLVIAAATAPLLSGSAHAGAQQVATNFVTTAHHRVGAGYVATATCRTVALSTDPQVVVLTSTVTCTINDDADTAALTGPVAVARIVTAADAPIRYCASGSATFLDTVTNDVFTIDADPTCVTFDA